MSEIGDEAVEKATGKDWATWHGELDAAGCADMTHKEIVAWLKEAYPKMGGWWQQAVTVEYEQARGMRAKHEKPEGFEVSKSKTIHVAVGEAFNAFHMNRQRMRWLPDHEYLIRKATPDKSLRITWSDGETHVDVYLWDKGPDKCQVQIQHKKLKDGGHAEAMKALWDEKLTHLQAYLEG